MSRKRKRLDSNHHAVVEAFQKVGYLVQSTSGIGSGFPDLVVSKAGRVSLIEIKAERGTHTPAQQTFTERGWPVYTVRSLGEVVAFALTHNQE